MTLISMRKGLITIFCHFFLQNILVIHIRADHPAERTTLDLGDSSDIGSRPFEGRVELMAEEAAARGVGIDLDD
jgi:hypothetical protein